MDIIYESGLKFYELLNTKYFFTISENRKMKKIHLDFQLEDFRHLSGLHYIDDISIEKDPRKVIKSILDQKITDALLNKSRKYSKRTAETGSIKDRIYQLRYLEDYLDKSDYIRIYKTQNWGSLIKADYYIEASLPASDTKKYRSTVYIFIRKRKENDSYVTVSFFKKTGTYTGTNVYWLLKEKEVDGKRYELYRNPKYTGN